MASSWITKSCSSGVARTLTTTVKSFAAVKKDVTGRRPKPIDFHLKKRGGRAEPRGVLLRNRRPPHAQKISPIGGYKHVYSPEAEIHSAADFRYVKKNAAIKDAYSEESAYSKGRSLLKILKSSLLLPVNRSRRRANLWKKS